MKRYGKHIAYFLLSLTLVVIAPWNLMHHHDSHVHDVHFFDDSNGLLSDHVFDDCDFCEYVTPYFYEISSDGPYAINSIQFRYTVIQEQFLKAAPYFNYFLRGPPRLVN